MTKILLSKADRFLGLLDMYSEYVAIDIFIKITFLPHNHNFYKAGIGLQHKSTAPHCSKHILQLHIANSWQTITSIHIKFILMPQTHTTSQFGELLLAKSFF
jgi:hypothetical protein